MNSHTKLAKLLCAMIAIRSDEKELELAQFISKQLSSYGFSTELQAIPNSPGRANIIANIGACTGKRILFEGHLDTVPAGERWSVAPFCGIIRQGRLFGRGAVDMKGGIAAMLVAAERLAADKALLQKGQLVLAFVCDEEQHCLGVKHYLSSPSFHGADYAIIAEPTDLHLCICHRGSCHYLITVYGVSSHAARPEKGVNAIWQGAKVLQLLKESSLELQARTHPFLDAPTLLPTMMRAGLQDNMVPDRCEIVVDARIFPHETAESAIQFLRGRLDSLAQEDPSFSYNIEITKEVLGGALQTDSPLACAAAEVYQNLFMQPASFRGFDVTCEQSILMQAGIPTIIFGPGDCMLAHAPDEYVEIDSLQKASEYYCELARHLLSK